MLESTALVIALAGALTGASEGRTILYHPHDIVSLRAKVRYSTLVVLPEDDEVIEITCGDKDSWAINAHGPLVSLKPARAGIETNLNVLTARGRIYAFVLTEVSESREGPDLTVFIEPADANGSEISPRRLDDCRQQADIARRETERLRRDYPVSLEFPYRILQGRADRGPFFVRAIFHDGRFTYIRARARELPSLYEIADGAPSLINFEVRGGTYIVPKVLESGYLAIGKQRLVFGK